jgi:hypothetical protein
MCGSGARWCARADAIFDVPDMHVLDVEIDDQHRLVLTVESGQLEAPCPVCGVMAVGHGRRIRILHDAPCFARVTLLRWLVRIWRCREPLCPTTTFSEFPSGFVDQAFERFSRADSARGGAGAGLGLALVRAIALVHGGRAWITANSATTVHLWLPSPHSHLISASLRRHRPTERGGGDGDAEQATSTGCTEVASRIGGHCVNGHRIVWSGIRRGHAEPSGG